MIRYLTVICSFCCSINFSTAQNPTIDSLWKAVEMADNLPAKVDELNYLGEEYKELDVKEAIEVSRRALKIATKIDYLEGIFYAYNNLGMAFDDIGKGDSAFFYMDRALTLAIDLEDDYALSVIKNNFGLHYLFRGNYPLALKYFQESLEKLENPGYYMDPVVTYNNIGVIHEEQGNVEKAIEYYEMANQVALQNGEIAFANLGFGYIEQLKKNFDQAIDFYEKSLEAYRTSKDELHTGETLYYIGECHLGNGAYEKAKAFLWDSFEIYEKLGLVSDVIEIYRTLGEVSEQAGQDEEALKYYHQAADLGEGKDLHTALVPVFGALARQYALKEDYEKAYQYQLGYQELNATIYNNDTKERIAQMQTSYELEVNKAERERLQAEQSQREIAVRQRTILAVGSMLVTVLLTILVTIYYRENKRRRILNKNLESKVRERTAELEDVNNQLLESNQELERFTYIASHDLKEPLRNITSFVNLIERKLGADADADIKEYMGYVTSNTRQMYNLIEDVLNFSQVVALDMREIDLLDLNVLMIDVEATLKQILQERNGRLQIVNPLPSVKAHKTHIFMVFKNLIENGLKYNESENPLIEVDFIEEPQFFCFSIRDNGIGINPTYHEQIFEMFKRMTTRDKYEGTGIGLAICKKIVNKYGGTFMVESEEGTGSTFYFRWPK